MNQTEFFPFHWPFFSFFIYQLRKEDNNNENTISKKNFFLVFDLLLVLMHILIRNNI